MEERIFASDGRIDSARWGDLGYGWYTRHTNGYSAQASASF